MSSLRPESHVAQQIRRDKLRIQNSSQHLQDFPTNIELLSLHPGLNSDFLQVRNVRSSNMLYEPAFYSSEIASFSTPSNTVSSGDEVKPSRLMLSHYASFPHSSASEPAPSSADQHRDNFGYDWMINYGSSSGIDETHDPNSNFSTELNNNNGSVYQHLAKPSYNELMGRQLGEMHHPSSPPPLFQNTLHDIVKYASISAQGSDHVASQMQHPGHGIWMGNQNQSNQFHFGNTNLSDPVNTQGLSLSLSSNSHSKVSLSGFPCSDGHGSDEPYSRCDKSAKSVMKPSSLVTKDCGKSLQDVVGITSSTSGYRSNVGPLGPFTGYATILKSSRFLKPAQELLDEFCNVCGSNNIIKAPDGSDFSRMSGEASAASAAEAVINATESGVSAKVSVSNAGAASCSILYNSKENSGDCESRGNFDCSSRPVHQQKRAKLLYMQEEVTRKYRQYHQQMQMVVSSFESVAGLSSATPYITMALKSVAKQYKCLKNAILDQIKHLKEVLGEDLSGSTSGAISKLDTGLTYLDQSFHHKNKTTFLEPQQVWRPQRGLPERAVAILKAWLFEHFLHPYPTDTDKHMLATQTGLSRNQVSNWFINARVRVWKPMVEEIHNLETKGMVGGNKQNEGTSGAEGSSQQEAMVEEHLGKFGRHGDVLTEKQFQCLGMSSSRGGNSEGLGFIMGSEQWNQEKRSKLECHVTPNMDGTLMGFVPYRRGAGFDVGGLGSVSLTLGLRHGVDGVQHHHQQQQLRQEDQIRSQFGEHMIRDFVG